MSLRDLRFEVPFSAAFEKGLLLVGGVEPDTEYQANRNAAAKQKADPVTGKRQWKATCTDPSETNPKRAAVQVIFCCDVQPIPVGAELVAGTGMRMIELEGLTLQPKVTGQGEFKSLGWTVRATGIKGDNSGSKSVTPIRPGQVA